ncbi:MAG: hypothetical protein ACR5K2_04280 [Wolbachia sp.]
MYNTITFELQANEYNIESSFNHREGSGIYTNVMIQRGRLCVISGL